MQRIGQVLKSNGRDGELLVSFSGIAPEEIDLEEPVFIEFDGLPVPFYFEAFNQRGNSRALVRLTGVHNLTDAEPHGCRRTRRRRPLRRGRPLRRRGRRPDRLDRPACGRDESRHRNGPRRHSRQPLHLGGDRPRRMPPPPPGRARPGRGRNGKSPPDGDSGRPSRFVNQQITSYNRPASQSAERFPRCP